MGFNSGFKELKIQVDRAGNIPCGSQNQSINAVWETVVSYDSHKTHNCTVWTDGRISER